VNETTFLAAVVAAIVTIMTKLIDAIVARRRDRSSGSIEHRKLLSDDERAFRQAVLDEVKGLRDEIKKKETLIDELRHKLSEAHQRANDADRSKAEAERRALLLEAQISDLRMVRRGTRRRDEEDG
jgi:septal ring factor EnvC (AmiA/AmiB activator)